MYAERTILNSLYIFNFRPAERERYSSLVIFITSTTYPIRSKSINLFYLSHYLHFRKLIDIRGPRSWWRSMTPSRKHNIHSKYQQPFDHYLDKLFGTYHPPHCTHLREYNCDKPPYSYKNLSLLCCKKKECCTQGERSLEWFEFRMRTLFYSAAIKISYFSVVEVCFFHNCRNQQIGAVV